MKIKAPGKVNLALDLVGTRPDGYHDLDMIMANINLFDELDIEPSDHDKIICQQEELPQNNTLTKTLDALRRHAGLKGRYQIHLTKNIPSQAGLGGASADAAALIHALCEMEQLPLSLEEKMAIGATIGADVPYCLCGGYARVQGIGEKVMPLQSDWKIPVLLVKPEEGVSTPACFKVFDEMEEHKPADIEIVADAVEKQDLALLYQTMTNRLEAPAFALLPRLEILKEKLQDAGIVRVVMSGSGSCLMGFCVDEDVMDEAAQELSTFCPFVRKAWIGS